MFRVQRRLGRRLAPILLSVALLTLLYCAYRSATSFSPHRPFNLDPFRLSSSWPFSGGSADLDPTAPIPLAPSSFDWTSVKPRYPVSEHLPLPAGEPRDLPPVQFAFAPEDAKTEGVMRERREAVKELFMKDWAAYRDRTFGMDEIGPISGRGKNTLGGWAATLVDGLDTLWIMDLHEEFSRAARFACAIDFGRSPAVTVNVFETTIRHLGGLISAYELSGATQPALLQKAVELGNLLYVAFDTPNRIPVFWLHLRAARQSNSEQMAGTREPSAAAASLCMEFTRLAQLTGDGKLYDAVERVKLVLHRWQNETWLPGLWPVYVDWQHGKAEDKRFSIGGNADSLYEYLPKMFALLGGLDVTYAAMSIAALDAVRDHLLFRPMLPLREDVLFSGDLFVRTRDLKRVSTRLEPQAQHLACFAGGMYALAGKILLRPDYINIGERLALGCAWAYEAMPSGIMPELSILYACMGTDKLYDAELAKAAPPAKSESPPLPRPAGEVNLLEGCPWDHARWEMHSDRRLPLGFQRVRDYRYLLRPEAVESLFYLWRITGDAVYREKAWRMFESIRASTAGAKFGSGSLESVLKSAGHGRLLDGMESYWFSETLKYFYLIFSPPDVVSLDEWVLNTEAHAFKRPKRMKRGPGA